MLQNIRKIISCAKSFGGYDFSKSTFQLNGNHTDTPIVWRQFIKFCENFKSQILDIYSDIFGKIIDKYNVQHPQHYIAGLSFVNDNILFFM